jgi:hypothetical protein
MPFGLRRIFTRHLWPTCPRKACAGSARSFRQISRISNSKEIRRARQREELRKQALALGAVLGDPHNLTQFGLARAGYPALATTPSPFRAYSPS